MTYDAPDHLEQRTFEPREQSVVLDHGMLTLQSGSAAAHAAAAGLSRRSHR